MSVRQKINKIKKTKKTKKKTKKKNNANAMDYFSLGSKFCPENHD